MKVIVIGGVAGGASAAARVRRLDEKAEITVFERGEHVSFSNCCLPYYLSGTVETADDLVMMTPAGFKKRYNIDVKTSCEITGINRAEHTVTAVDVLTGAEQDYPYDRLVIATGSSPKPLGIPGENGGNVFTVRNVTDVVRIKSFLEDTGAAHVAVYGGGPVGIEVAENLALAGKKITLILHGKQILSSAYDDDMVQLLHRELLNNGIEILLETEVKSIGEGVVSLSGKNGGSTLSADAVILAAGTVPNSELAAAAGLDLASDGAIRTDDAYRTSDPDIYAVGDVIEVYNPLSAGSGRIALAGPAQMAARTAADGICGLKSQSAGFIGSSCIKVFGLNAASTGLTEKKAVRCGYSCDSVLAFPGDKVGIMPDSNYLAIKLIFEKPSGRILGAQAIGKGDAVGRVNAIASMLKLGATLEDLKNAELCYSPVYGTAKDAVNMAALVGLNVLNGVFRQVHVSEVRGLVESGAVIIDVREPREYAAGHVKGALNIPLGEIRSRAGEIPRDVPVYLHCRSSQRSYYAICCLQGLGFTNVVNISGSFLGISLYEYFNDVMLSREPIVTAYNFN